MSSEIYLPLHLCWTGPPPGATTVWLIQPGVKRGVTFDPYTRLSPQHHRGGGRDQPQSSSGHVPFHSPLVKAATNHSQGGRLWCFALLTSMTVRWQGDNMADYRWEKDIRVMALKRLFAKKQMKHDRLKIQWYGEADIGLSGHIWISANG